MSNVIRGLEDKNEFQTVLLRTDVQLHRRKELGILKRSNAFAHGRLRKRLAGFLADHSAKAGDVHQWSCGYVHGFHFASFESRVRSWLLLLGKDEEAGPKKEEQKFSGERGCS